jgi:hypothetical protein
MLLTLWCWRRIVKSFLLKPSSPVTLPRYAMIKASSSATLIPPDTSQFAGACVDCPVVETSAAVPEEVYEGRGRLSAGVDGTMRRALSRAVKAA